MGGTTLELLCFSTIYFLGDKGVVVVGDQRGSRASSFYFKYSLTLAHWWWQSHIHDQKSLDLVVFLIIFSIVSVNFAQSFLNDARDTVSLDYPSFPANYCDISSSGEKNKMCNGRVTTQCTIQSRFFLIFKKNCKILHDVEKWNRFLRQVEPGSIMFWFSDCETLKNHNNLAKKILPGSRSITITTYYPI